MILLEAGRLGWGASGRNGGQAIPGWRKGANELIAQFGRARAKRLFEFALDARTLTLTSTEPGTEGTRTFKLHLQDKCGRDLPRCIDDYDCVAGWCVADRDF